MAAALCRICLRELSGGSDHKKCEAVLRKETIFHPNFLVNLRTWAKVIGWELVSHKWVPGESIGTLGEQIGETD